VQQESLPPGWKKIRLGEHCAKPQYGHTARATDKSIGPKFLRITDLQDGAVRWDTVPYCECDDESRTLYRLKPGDIVIARIGATTGKALMLRDCPEAIFASYLMRLRPSQTIISEFLGFYFQTADYWSQINQNKGGRLKGGINIPVLQNLTMPLPSIPEQRAIAHALQAVQQATEARGQELELERERKAALMQHLFTYGTRGEPLKQSDIGEIPQSWQVIRFSEVVEIAQGQVDPTIEPYKNLIHVGPENIEPGTGRLIATKTNQELNIISGNYLFTETDILYSKIRPYLNKVALPTSKGTCSADMYPLRPKPEYLVREFVFQLLLSDGFKVRAMSFQDRTGIPKINRNQLGSIPLPIPSLSEQHEISELLSACDSKILALEQETSVLNELFTAMLEELMTGRLSVSSLIGEVENE
jgi:type I restriction enzyme, S subunit